MNKYKRLLNSNLQDLLMKIQTTSSTYKKSILKRLILERFDKIGSIESTVDYNDAMRACKDFIVYAGEVVDWLGIIDLKQHYTANITIPANLLEMYSYVYTYLKADQLLNREIS